MDKDKSLIGLEKEDVKRGESTSTTRPKLTAEEFEKIWTGALRNDPHFSHFYIKKPKEYLSHKTIEVVEINGYDVIGDIVILGNKMKLPNLVFQNSSAHHITISDVIVDSIIIDKVRLSYPNPDYEDNGYTNEDFYHELPDYALPFLKGNFKIENSEILDLQISSNEIGNIYFKGNKKENSKIYICVEADIRMSQV